jgi:hypothetical protein
VTDRPNDSTTMMIETETSGDALAVSGQYVRTAQAVYREHKDIRRMLAVAEAGVRFCLDAAQRADPDDGLKLKRDAKLIAYNAGANCWPGWGDEGVIIEQDDIERGLKLATQSLQLVEALRLGNKPLGKAHWLIGALRLAQADTEAAVRAFSDATDAFAAEQLCVSQLMTEAYLALARKRLIDNSGDGKASFEDACRRLEQEGSQEALFYLQQLRRADQLLL